MAKEESARRIVAPAKSTRRSNKLAFIENCYVMTTRSVSGAGGFGNPLGMAKNTKSHATIPGGTLLSVSGAKTRSYGYQYTYLHKKTHLHSPCSAIAPPKKGPGTNPRANTAPPKAVDGIARFIS